MPVCLPCAIGFAIVQRRTLAKPVPPNLVGTASLSPVKWGFVSRKAGKSQVQGVLMDLPILPRAKNRVIRKGWLNRQNQFFRYRLMKLWCNEFLSYALGWGNLMRNSKLAAAVLALGIWGVAPALAVAQQDAWADPGRRLGRKRTWLKTLAPSASFFSANAKQQGRGRWG